MTYYVAFSGGADSTAVAILLKEQGVDYELVFADTGVELPETYWMIPRVARVLGKKLHVVSNGTFFQHLVNYNFLIPGFQRRWCTRILKQVPQAEFFNEDDTVDVGVRADEPNRMKGDKSKYTVKKSLQEKGLDKQGVFKLCNKWGLMNPIYKWRSNCSCWCCPVQRLDDWRGLSEEHPDLYSVAARWEREATKRAVEGGHNVITFLANKTNKWGNLLTLDQLREQHESKQRLFCPTCGVSQ